ncbi:hypothetical protein BD779DRAFT_1544613 [Infundibulicybe gibba]|nr:hypothetical protein BD779DRAFT_1544613 [Infundibulicybe gibba]
MINRLVFYAINVGILISATDLVVLALSSSGPHFSTVNLYYLALFEIVGNLYANSLLASLNARTSLRQQADAEYLSSFNVGTTLQSMQQSGTITKTSITPDSRPENEQKLGTGVSATTDTVLAAIV